MSFHKMGGGSYQCEPAMTPGKSRFASNPKNMQSSDSSMFMLGSREGIMNDSVKSFEDKRARGIKKEVGMKFGVSHEAPSFFHGSHSVVANKSYNNPHMNREDHREQQIKQSGTRKSVSQITNVKNVEHARTYNNFQTYHIKDTFQDPTHKEHEIFQMRARSPVESYNCVTHGESTHNVPNLRLQEKRQFDDGYHKLLAKQGSFKRTKEYFLDFVENNDVMNVYGPLAMKARPKKHRQVKVYNLNEEEQARKDKIRNAMKNFVSNLSLRLKAKGPIVSKTLSSSNQMSLSKNLVNMFAATSAPREKEYSDQIKEDDMNPSKGLFGLQKLKTKPLLLKQGSSSSNNVFPDHMEESYTHYGLRGNNSGVLSPNGSQQGSSPKNQQSFFGSDSMAESQAFSPYQTNNSVMMGSSNESTNKNRFNYLKDRHAPEVYEQELPLIGHSKTQSTMNQHVGRDIKINHHPINAKHNKSYTHFYKTIGGVSNLRKTEVMKCLRPPKKLALDGDQFLDTNSKFRRQLSDNLQREMLQQQLSSRIFKKPQIYQTPQEEQVDSDFEEREKNYIDDFEKKHSRKESKSNQYSQGFVWFNNMASLTQTVRS